MRVGARRGRRGTFVFLLLGALAVSAATAATVSSAGDEPPPARPVPTTTRRGSPATPAPTPTDSTVTATAEAPSSTTPTTTKTATPTTKQTRPSRRARMHPPVVAEPVVRASRARVPVRPPDIVLVVVDDLRADQLAGLPNVRALQRNGVTFTDAFATNSICCASRASILTGGRSSRTGVWSNYPPAGGWPAFRDDESDTIATRLQRKGYRTGLVGKYLNFYDPQPLPSGRLSQPPGWDAFSTFVGANGRYLAFRWTRDGVVHRSRDGRLRYSTDLMAHDAVEFVRSTPRRQPLFLTFTPFAPHTPYRAAARHDRGFVAKRLLPSRTPSYDEADVSDKPGYVRHRDRLPAVGERRIARLQRRQYKSMLAVDEAMGDIFRALRARGSFDRTFVVFASDNGLLWGEHRLVGLKEAPYEASIRIPLVISAPWFPARGAQDALVANYDIAATIAAVADTAAPFPDGRSLLPLLVGNDVEWRTRIPLEHHFAGGVGIPSYCGLRTADWKIVAYANGARELYDLRRDPDELDNVYRDPRVRNARRELWEQLRVECQRRPPGMPPLPPSPRVPAS